MLLNWIHLSLCNLLIPVDNCHAQNLKHTLEINIIKHVHVS